MSDRLYKNIIWGGLTAILIFAPIARGAVKVWSITPVLLIIYFLVFLWLWQLNNKLTTNHQLLSTSLDIPILLFIILAIISFAFSIYKHDSFYALLRLFAYIGLYYLIVNNYSRRIRRYLVGLVITIGAGLSIYGLLQYFNILPHTWWIPKNFLASTYVNHNHFSGYLELVIPVTIGVLIRYKSLNPTLKLVLVEALVAMIAAFILAQSRGGWISLFLSLIVMNIIMIRSKILNKKSLFMPISIIIVVFSFAYLKSSFVSERIDTLTKLTEEEASLQTRIKIWQGAMQMIKNSPLIGIGIGNFDWGFSRFRPEGLDVRACFAHNDYLHMAAEMGILAPLIMILLLAIVIGRGIGGYEGRGKIHPVILGCTMGMLSLALHGLVDFNFHIPANMILFTVYAAIIMGEKLKE